MNNLKKHIVLLPILLLILGACGKREDQPTSAADFTDGGIRRIQDALDPERKKLEVLRAAPSVTSATIQNEFSPECTHDANQYMIDLDEATASIWIPGQETKNYCLNHRQVDELKRLLSEYAITVYDGMPYWPTGDYCTMIQLFDFSIQYDGGYYREYGATHYPEEWESFLQELRELIISEDSDTC